MRVPLAFAALLALAGCSGPDTLVVSGTAVDDAFECALAEATALRYTVVDVEDGVFVRAHQPKRFRFGRGDNEFDVLTASVARGRLTVTATGEEHREGGTVAIDPSGAAEEEAAAVLAACTR